MAVPNEDSPEARLPYRPKDNSSFTGAAFRSYRPLLALWRDPQGDGRMRPGDWLVLLIGSALISVTALVFLRFSVIAIGILLARNSRNVELGTAIDKGRATATCFGARW